MTLKKTPIFILKVVAAVTFALLCANTSAAAERWLTVIWDENADEIAKFEAFCMERGMTSFDVLEANDYPAGELPSQGEELLVPESKNDVFATWMEVQNRKGAKPLVTVRLHGIPANLRENVPAAEPTVPAPEPITPSPPPPEPVVTEEQPMSLRESGLSVREFLAQTQDAPLITIRPHEVPGLTRDHPEETLPAGNIPSRITVIEIPSESAPPEPARTEIYRPIEAIIKPDTEPGDPIRNIRIVVSGDEVVLLTSDREESLSGTESSQPVPAIVERDVIMPRPETLTPPRVPPPVVSETTGKMMWPVSGRVSSGFGRRGRRHHTGIDIPMPSGTPIVAAMDGVVLETGTSRDRRFRGYGNTVVLDHGNGLATWYTHCSKFNVQKGQRVTRGDVIAFVGNTGRTTTHHIHFEVRVNGRPVNPIPYLEPR